MAYPGQDFSTFSLEPVVGAIGTMDVDYKPISGDRVCIEILVRKLTAPSGSYDDLTWGLDLRDYLGANVTPQDLSELQSRCRSEIMREEFVDDATVTLYLSDTQLVCDISVSLSDAPTYDFAFALSEAGIKLLIDDGA